MAGRVLLGELTSALSSSIARVVAEVEDLSPSLQAVAKFSYQILEHVYADAYWIAKSSDDLSAKSKKHSFPYDGILTADRPILASRLHLPLACLTPLP